MVQPGQVPRRYELVVPQDWWRIPLEDEDRRRRSVRALVRRQFRGVDCDPRTRRELKEVLDNVADSGQRRGGVELYVSTGLDAGVPLPASLLVSVIRPEELGAGGPTTPDELYMVLRDSAPDVSVVPLDAGRALRRRRELLRRDVRDLGHQKPGTELDYFVPVPHSTALLLLSFSTPLGEVSGALVELFDAVAASLHWGAEPAGRAGCRMRG